MSWLAAGSEFRELIGDGDVIVGSGADADWRVSSADLMPRHFVVSTAGAVTTVRSNTFDTVLVVNGAQVALDPLALSDGDAILAGSGRFAFTLAPPTVGPAEAGDLEVAYLVDDQRHVAHPLDSRSTPIGRDTSNAVVIRDPTASRFHAEVRREAGGFAVRSMGATGTILNRRPLERPTMLGEGDVVEVAFLKLRFTRLPLPGNLVIAEPHPPRNDEAARKRTLGGVRAVADDTLAAAGRGRRLPWFVGVLLLVAASAWWLAR